MPKQLQKSKKGFTIIEVVLVLAIAGLIFLMVFLALPALQRSQRDTQRRDDLARFQTQITQYQTNNRGKLPGTGVSETGKLKAAYANFMINYLWVNGDDQFVDPDGELYQIGGICASYGSKSTADFNGGQDCSGTDNGGSKDGIAAAATTLATTNPLAGSAFAATDEWDGVSTPTADQLYATVEDVTTFNHAIFIYQGATCDGEKVIAASGARKIAIQFKLEGGGVYCGNN